MCVAIHKNKGVKLPTMDVFRDCWDTNPDGAGIAVKRKDSIEIMKGFMTFDEFVKGFEQSKVSDDDEAFFHFRIATAGGINRACCHPFPVSKSVRKLKNTHFFSDEVLIHNGVLPIIPRRKDISDTMELCIKLAGTDDRFQTLKLIEPDVVGNRLGLMSMKKETLLTGGWHDVDGVSFSNLNWEKCQWRGFKDDGIFVGDYADDNKCDCATCEYADVCNGNYVNKYGECELYIPEGLHDFTPEEKKAIFGDAEWSMSQYGYEG